MTPPRAPARLSRLAPPLVFAAAVLALLPVLGNGFVDWDDPVYLTGNILYRGLAWTNIRWMFTNTLQSVYQPLAWLTLAVDHALWGMEPGGYHLQSLLWHAASSVLFYFLAARVLARARGDDEETTAAGALVAALFFAVHPLRAEAVAWASERRELVGDFFWLLGAWFYLRPRPRPEALPRATTACLLLALLAKGTMLSLPLVLLVLDYYPLRRLASPRDLVRRAWEKWPLFALSAAFGVVGVRAASAQGEDALSFALWSPAQRLAQLAFGLAFYAGKTILPRGLSYLYYMPPDLNPLQARFVLSAAVVLAAAAALWASRRRFPAAAAAAAAYAAALFPVIGVVKYGPHLAADRYANLSCLPIAVAAGAGFAALSSRRETKPAARLLAPLALALLGALAWNQAASWRDSRTLWTRALAADPENPFARANLGVAAAESGDLGRAEAELRRAYELAPDAALVAEDWGVFLSRRGRWPEAAEVFRRLSARERLSAKARALLARALARSGRPAEAEAAYRQALLLAPAAAEFRHDFGVFLLERGRRDEARAQFEAALAADPARAESHVDLGLLLSQEGRKPESYAHFRAALSSPDGAVKALAHFNWGNALCDEGRNDAAIRHYRESARLDPDLQEARFNLGNTLARVGRYADAVAAYRALLVRAPSHAGARRNLAAALALSRR